MSVVVKYRTEQRYCHCCGQEFPEVKKSNLQEIEFTKKTALNWTDDWGLIAEFPEDLESLVSEFIHQTIDFWILGSNERCIVEDSEIEKVTEFILREVVTSKAEGHQVD